MKNTKLILALVGLVLLTGAKCEGKTQAPENPDLECADVIDPPVPPDLQQKRYVSIRACVELEYAPYEVTIHVADGQSGATLGDTTEHAASGSFTHIVGYDAGSSLLFTVALKPSRAGSKNGYIVVRDGKANIKRGKVDGRWKTSVQLRVSR